MVLLHTFWGVVFFAALDTKKWLHVVIVVASHMLFSGLVSHRFHIIIFYKYLVYKHCFYYLGTTSFQLFNFLVDPFISNVPIPVVAEHRGGGGPG